MQILNTLIFPDLFSDIWFRIKEALFLIKSFALLPWCGFFSFFRIEIFVFCRFWSREQLLSIISLFEFEFECDDDDNTWYNVVTTNYSLITQQSTTFWFVYIQNNQVSDLQCVVVSNYVNWLHVYFVDINQQFISRYNTILGHILNSNLTNTIHLAESLNNESSSSL